MFCLYCGSSLPEDAMFCSRCGKQQNAGATGPVSSNIPTAPTVPPAPITALVPTLSNLPSQTFYLGEQQLAREQVMEPIPGQFSGPRSMNGRSGRISRRNLIVAGLAAAGVAAVGGGAWWLTTKSRHPDYLHAQWSETGSLRTVREFHKAVLLQNGKVFVAGGLSQNANRYTSVVSVEQYDPASGTWSIAKDLRVGRSNPTATVLQDGKVLITGGWNDIAYTLPSTELYDPANGNWLPTTDMLTARYAHTATLLQDGKVLVVGGLKYVRDSNGNIVNDTLSSAELYDPATGTWSAVGNLSSPRVEHSATLLSDGKVLVAGGETNFYSRTSDFLSSAELYDPVSGVWSPTGALKVEHQNPIAVLLQDGKVLVVGGLSRTTPLSSTELYDPVSGTWSHTGNMSVARWLHTATLLPDGKVVVVGGGNTYESTKPLPSVELYDPANNTWTLVAHVRTARYNHTSTLLQNGKVLVVGGKDYNDNQLSSAELYG